MDRAIAASLPAPPDVRMSQRVAKRAQDLGYESLWIADVGGPDPFVIAAAAAAVTERVRIGTAVIPAYTRTPPVIAGAAASCAELAPGRFVLGVGASSENIVQNWSGVPFRRPLARVRETVTTVRAILAGERTDFDGRTLSTHGYRLLMQTPAPRAPAGTRRRSRSSRASRSASPTTRRRHAPSCARRSGPTSRPRSTTASSPGAASTTRRRRSWPAGRRRTAAGSRPA